MLYWFVIYDLCQVTAASTVQLKIENKVGKFDGYLEGRLDPVETFKVICVEQDSDWFVPREDHASCSDSTQRLWVFGGRSYAGE